MYCYNVITLGGTYMKTSELTEKTLAKFFDQFLSGKAVQRIFERYGRACRCCDLFPFGTDDD